MSDAVPYRRILVTGGRGFVGRRLVDALLALPDPSREVVRGVSAGGVTGAGEQVVDLLDPAGIDMAIASIKPDMVVHLAAQSWSVGSTRSPADSWTVNCAGTLSLASSIARHAPAAAFLYVSSAEVYGLGFNDGMVTEATPPHPITVYARSKAAAEMLLRDVLPSTVRLVIVRPSNHTGAGQDERFVVPAFAAQIARIERGAMPPVIKVGDLSSQRDFLDVRDVVDAYLTLMRVMPDLNGQQVFNVGSGQAVKIETILTQLLALTDCTVDVVIDPERLRPNQVPVAVNDASALRALTGWCPRFQLSETLHSVLTDQRARVASTQRDDEVRRPGNIVSVRSTGVRS